MNGLWDKYRNYTYYVLIGVLSLVCVFFLPMLGSEVGLDFVIPDTPAGWAVFVMTKLSSAVINVLLLVCFMNQGKLNIKDNPRYMEACKILDRVKDPRTKRPRSPRQYLGWTYGKKGTTIFLSSVASTFALTQAILTFDWVSLLTYLFVLIVGIVFGVLQMRNAEIYWTDEYYQYAQMIKEQEEKTNGNSIQQQNLS